MNKVTFDYVGLLTPAESKQLWLVTDHSVNYPEEVHANTHLNDFGARVISQLTAKRLAKLSTPLAKEIAIS